ncbi:MAG: aminotransferase class I/II-fold pyridoxal phosphate-dependent enzyme, partial [Bacteroidales bacterium]|nr:aminotransferase class I/II-fold pyridoxal phosphate-dependent enzyme [Bacteroidales bacterium]
MNVPFFRYDWFFQENREQIISVHEEIMSSGRYVYGEYTQKLEKQLAELCNRKFATTVGSCSDALFFALQSVGIKDGDEVIVPPFSFVATLDSILRCDGVPVFVDISPEHFML